MLTYFYCNNFFQMSFNTPPHSHFPFRPSSQTVQHNVNENLSYFTQRQFANVERFKTQQTNESYIPHFNVPNSSFLNIPLKNLHDKLTPEHFQRKIDNWKHAEINTARSMIFTQPQKQPIQAMTTKREFSKTSNLSEMARTVRNFDDNESFDTNRIIDSTKNISEIPDRKTQHEHVSKFGNTLTIQTNNFKNIQPKETPIAHSIFFTQNVEKSNNMHKSFINNPSPTNNNINENKNPNGLQFLKRFKNNQQEKKQKQSPNNNPNMQLKFKSSRVIEGKTNFNNTLGNNGNSKFFHEHSAPEIRYLQRNYHHHDSSVVNGQQKNEDIQKNIKKEFFSPSHNPLTINLTNNSSQLSSPVQQGPNQIFFKKLPAEKSDHFIPQKSFRSQSELADQKETNASIVKQPSFFKKDSNKIGTESTEETAQNTPAKDKFSSLAFLKNRQTKMFSESKTMQTTPSPTSFKKSKLNYGEKSPTYVKSTFSDEKNNNESKPRQWSLNDFQLGDKLGKGAFGDVFMAREKQLGFMCVLKRMSKKRIRQLKRQQQVIRQMKIQLFLNHRHLTSMYGYFQDSQNIYLILQYLTDGNLAQLKRRKRTSEKQTAQIIYQVCQGLAFMHKLNIIHRDIKPENIFVNEGFMKLGDFGCSVDTDQMRRTVVSCLEYSSPEQLNGDSYNQKIDVWGVGVLAYELLVGRSPFEKELMTMNAIDEDVDKKFTQINFPLQLNLSTYAQDFIKSLLNIDPIQRMSIEEALQHKFITTNYKAENHIYGM